VATAIKIWEIIDGDLKPINDEAFATSHREGELEEWIVKHPEVLGGGQGLLIIDRQRDIPGVGRLDLLGLDSNGQLVIVELKRDRAPREAVAQALDYASWLNGESPETIRQNAANFLRKPLHEALQEAFDPPAESGLELDSSNHRIVLVAARLDASAERIISYLSERHGVEINAVFFTYAKLSDGKEVVARTALIADEGVRIRAAGEAPKRPSRDELRSAAESHGAAQLFDECRAVGKLWREERVAGFDGSLVYWADNKTVFGIVASARFSPPPGSLDVWINKNLSAALNLTLETIRVELQQRGLTVREEWADKLWLRLSNIEQARSLVAQLRQWKPQASATAGA
jgi:Endonuclease NucS